MPKLALRTLAVLGGLTAAGAANALTLTSPDIKQDAKIADEQVLNSSAVPAKTFHRR
jgi:hypothetical protein